MQEPSIRSFTLDYYRSLGAELTPMDASARQWQVELPPRGDQLAQRPLSISFDPSAESSQIKAMGRTNPAWREILSSCLAARTVAYRHIVSEPVGALAAHFAALLPELGVQAAHLVSVTPAAAVGFTHRVTFEAPAMASRQEQLHHDLMDASSGGRLDSLSEVFYTLPSIPISPPAAPGLLPIEELHARALRLVDGRTEAHGETLEAELAPRRREAEERIERYYAARIAEIHAQQERELDAKLEYLVGRAQATRMPGALAKLQAEAAEVAEELEQIRIRRELEGQGLRDQQAERCEAERARHEVTVETALVSVAYVTYDVVRYRLDLELADATGSLEIEWVPVTDEVRLPPCPGCASPYERDALSTLGLDEQGALICRQCAQSAPAQPAPEPSARAEAVACSRCGMSTPTEAAQRCHLSEAPFCVVCALTCNECGQVTAREYLRPNPHGRGMICPDHAVSCASCGASAHPRETFACASCNQRHCQAHAVACPSCGMPRCSACGCTQGNQCPACTNLQRIGAAHPLVQVLQGLIPDLGGLGWSWKLAVQGDFALIQWRSPLGRRGHAVLGTQDYLLITWKEKGPFARKNA